ncbi:hypothetical protein ACB094_11G073500 [Castanea mollissima]
MLWRKLMSKRSGRVVPGVENSIVQKRRQNLTNFDRFKLMLAKIKRAGLVKQELAKLKRRMLHKHSFIWISQFCFELSVVVLLDC